MLKSLMLFMILTACDKSQFGGTSLQRPSLFENAFMGSRSSNLEPIGPVSDKPKELSVRLFASAQFEAGVDACKKPPTTYEFVSTRLSPFAYCVEGNGRKSPDLQLCLKINSQKASEELPESCWFSPKDFENVAVLFSGANLLSLHARDGKGNTASDDKKVYLDPGIAPEIKILRPSQAAVSAGFEKSKAFQLSFEVRDNDTPIEKVRVSVQLTSRDGSGATRAIACNFANSKQWKQCPEGATTNPADFVIDKARSTFSYQLAIPEDYDTRQSFVIMITAIDQSGNAAVTSTGDVGTGWEVVAGRTYKGA